MKKVLAMLVASAIALSFAACGAQPEAEEVAEAPSEAQEVAVEEPEEEEEEEEPEAEPVKAEASGELGDSLYSFKVQLDGVVYELPCPMSELIANGWTSEDFGEVSLSSNQYASTNFEKDGVKVHGYVVNTGGDTLDLADCEFGGISHSANDSYYGYAEIVLPGGITWGSTLQEMLDAYGEASDVYEGSMYDTHTYSTSSYGHVKINIEDGVVEKIDIRNLLAKADNSGIDADNLDLPPEMDRYVAPTELGDSWDSMTVLYAGDLYQLPAPVAEFLKNGWEIVDDATTPVGSKSQATSVKMRKDNQELSTHLYNYSDTEQPLTGCWVTKVEYKSYGPTLPIELPGGITEKSFEDDVKAAYGAYDKEEEGGSTFTYGYYGDLDASVQFNFDADTGEVKGIEVTCRPRELPW